MEFMEFETSFERHKSRMSGQYGEELSLAELQGVAERHAPRALRQRELQTDAVQQLRGRVRRQCISCPQPLHQVPVLPGNFAQVGIVLFSTSLMPATLPQAQSSRNLVIVCVKRPED